MGWIPFNTDNARFVAEHIQFQAQHQLKPEQIFSATVEFCWKHRLEISSFHHLANVITDSFNIVESALLHQLQEQLTEHQCTELEALLNSDDQMHSVLSEFKKFSHFSTCYGYQAQCGHLCQDERDLSAFF